MKVHYINILLFAFPLNILEHNERNHKSTTLHTPKIPTTRLLCECELLYAPANYDNDAQMKKVMQQFDDRTSQRFHEYDDRMVEKRKQCKDKCDKEIQKIILKDKLEKQMEHQLTALETKIDTNDIPTCICEKSIADKTEKFCLNCGKTMGGVAPGWGLVSGLGYVAWSHYFNTTVVKMATDAGIKKGLEVGLVKVTQITKQLFGSSGGEIPAIEVLHKITAGKFTDRVTLHGIFKCISSNMNGQLQGDKYELFSTAVDTWAGKTLTQFNRMNPIPVAAVEKAVEEGKAGVLTQAGNVTSNLTTGIIASVVAIVVIVLIMVIIYLVLRYRRKKKMKKKQKYIKLLEE
ncbi:rifin [Plasmodium reichenowi]|uniref:Rifin n=1 Tax=Plasmodium reichenowi TaxID=5854 RepID=A0A060RRQ6_PLARE|nr:rifin [Plasmodium reichenowi]